LSSRRRRLPVSDQRVRTPGSGPGIVNVPPLAEGCGPCASSRDGDESEGGETMTQESAWPVCGRTSPTGRRGPNIAVGRG